MDEVTRAINLIKEKGFITEVEIPSVSNTLFRKALNEQLEKENINYYCFAEEYENEGWIYNYYQSDISPDITDLHNHSRNHYFKEEGYVYKANNK